MRSIWTRLSLAGVLCLAASVAAPLQAQGPGSDPVTWPEPQRAFWMDGPGLLLTDDQRDELRDMDAEARGLWIDRFLSDDPVPTTPVHELTEGLERRRQLVREEFLTPSDVRAQLLFLNGPPLERRLVECGTAFKPLEIWTYGRDRFSEPGALAGEEVETTDLVVYQPGPDAAWVLWLPLDSKRPLYTNEMAYYLEQWEESNGRLFRARRFDLQVCKDDARTVDEATGVRGLRDFQQERPGREELARYLEPPRNLGAWAILAADTQVPDDARTTLNVGNVEVFYPERQGQRMLTRTVLTLPPDAGFAVDELAEEPEIRLSAKGLVEKDGEIFDEFRVRFKVEPREDGGPLTLVVDRALRPDTRAVLRLELLDEVTEHKAWISRGLDVPRQADPGSGPRLAGLDGTSMTLAEELEVQRIPGADSLVIVPPVGDVVIGLWRVEVLVTGESIQKVVYHVDGQTQLTRSNPPWTAELRLSPFPTEQVIRVEGLDASGKLVAEDELVLNQPRGTFRVRVTEPAQGATVEGEVLAKAEITVPDERTLEIVEFRLDNELVETLEQPPWQTRIEVEDSGETSFLTVSAVLDDGTRTEEVRFLNAPEYLEQVEVNLVELYTAVTDRNNRPAGDLTVEDFEVLEDGRKQEIVKFERVENLPLTVGITIDTSGSMVDALGEAKRAAVDFLEAVIRPGDKTFAVAFSSKASLLMPPTDDVKALSDMFQQLQPVGWTALHDAIVTSLYYFRGIRGQKAMVLLSDGDDTTSGIKFEQALEYAQRSGVAVYTVGLDVGALNVSVRNKLSSLATQTGGRSFFISKAEELSQVYEEIENELRSRYLIAYASDRPATEEGYREVEVKVKRRGYDARTLRGYYP